MTTKIGRAREAVIQFFKTCNPQDEFFFVSFSESAELMSTFTNSIEDLRSHLIPTAPKGRTALLDAIYLGYRQMRGAHSSRRALLIVSDRGDNHSRYSESDLRRLVREADTQLYAIGIFDPLEYRSRTPEELNGPSLLSEITEMTGGRLFAVENLNELPDTAEKIAMELRNQYILGYRPSNKAHDARWRKIKVKLGAQRASSSRRFLEERLLRAEPLALVSISVSVLCPILYRFRAPWPSQVPNCAHWWENSLES